MQLAPLHPLKTAHTTNGSGFTLIEMSIVLVIIGLIIGGILMGNVMIKSAEMRSEISQYEKYTAAANTFRLKYGGLPGDITNATAFFTGTSQTTVNGGDGNGFVCSLNPANASFISASGNTECSQFFVQLYLAGLVDYMPVNVPAGFSPGAVALSKIKGSFIVYAQTVSATVNNVNGSGTISVTADSKHYYLNGISVVADSVNSVDGWPQSWLPDITQQLDTKIDDGLPLTGIARLACRDQIFSTPVYEGQPNVRCRSASSTRCVSNGLYNVGNSTPDCGLKIQAGF